MSNNKTKDREREDRREYQDLKKINAKVIQERTQSKQRMTNERTGQRMSVMKGKEENREKKRVSAMG